MDPDKNERSFELLKTLNEEEKADLLFLLLNGVNDTTYLIAERRNIDNQFPPILQILIPGINEILVENPYFPGISRDVNGVEFDLFFATWGCFYPKENHGLSQLSGTGATLRVIEYASISYFHYINRDERRVIFVNHPIANIPGVNILIAYQYYTDRVSTPDLVRVGIMGTDEPPGLGSWADIVRPLKLQLGENLLSSFSVVRPQFSDR